MPDFRGLVALVLVLGAMVAIDAAVIITTLHGEPSEALARWISGMLGAIVGAAAVWVAKGP